MKETRAGGLQSIYYAGRPEALAPLRDECQAIAAGIVRRECRRRGMHLPVDALEEIASDAAGQLMAHYLRNPEYWVRNFPSRIAFEVRNVMNAPLRSQQGSFEEGLESTDEADAHESASDAKHDAPRPALALDAMVADHPQGKKIAADLYRSRYYRQAIRRIAVYVERRWIYEHAETLHQVFRTFHWRPARHEEDILGSGYGRVREALRCGKRKERITSDRGADKVAER
ncbi:MAG: hypothetical protein PHS14_10515 [Elusimicrobia bacterium]|nr:hypothetical protein [Elusimicrobiota bacterium]